MGADRLPRDAQKVPLTMEPSRPDYIPAQVSFGHLTGDGEWFKAPLRDVSQDRKLTPNGKRRK